MDCYGLFIGRKEEGLNRIGVDTNFDNVEMLALLDRLHYLHCGRVWYERDGQPIERMAFEKVINPT